MTEVKFVIGTLCGTFALGLFFGLGFAHAIRWAVKRGGGVPVRIENLTVRYVVDERGEEA